MISVGVLFFIVVFIVAGFFALNMIGMFLMSDDWFWDSPAEWIAIAIFLAVLGVMGFSGHYVYTHTDVSVVTK